MLFIKFKHVIQLGKKKKIRWVFLAASSTNGRRARSFLSFSIALYFSLNRRARCDKFSRSTRAEMSLRLCLFSITANRRSLGFSGRSDRKTIPDCGPEFSQDPCGPGTEIQTRCSGFCLSSYIYPEFQFALTRRLLRSCPILPSLLRRGQQIGCCCP